LPLKFKHTSLVTGDLAFVLLTQLGLVVIQSRLWFAIN